mgnify:CR=1 FL=1
MDSHVVIHNKVYHQRDGYQPTGIVHHCVRKIKSDQPTHVIERMTVGADWTQIPLGHVDEVGSVIIENLEGSQQRETIPSPAEVDEMASRVIEISLGSPEGDLYVGPCESQVLGGMLHRSVRLRSGNGKILQCKVQVVPK